MVTDESGEPTDLTIRFDFELGYFEIIDGNEAQTDTEKTAFSVTVFNNRRRPDQYDIWLRLREQNACDAVCFAVDKSLVDSLGTNLEDAIYNHITVEAVDGEIKSFNFCKESLAAMRDRDY